MGSVGQSFFELLYRVYALFLADRNQTNVTPVPQEVSDAVEEELEEPWMLRLAEFTRDRLEAAARPGLASSAAEIRQAFFEFCGGEVPKKEVALRLARKGFAEETVHHWVGVRRTTKRVYRFRIGDAKELVSLRDGSTGGPA